MMKAPRVCVLLAGPREKMQNAYLEHLLAIAELKHKSCFCLQQSQQCSDMWSVKNFLKTIIKSMQINVNGYSKSLPITSTNSSAMPESPSCTFCMSSILCST